ncbi:OOP family OmpA-OmpF porin [Idiomarina aquatica]|uniref:OOP family OmpA-OmpF porin n=1 Tax=Idiomarina aquatica TaxID=1327752 RepID=A0A4R6P6D6_9GAMM|nr:OmpA family protein [Idiomarina aquatica]TDP33277.1 OOP family OmpA-OmpF porin [Idiomarina aquatica]
MKKLNTVLLALVSVGMTSVATAQQTQVEKNDIYVGARMGAFSADPERVAIDNNAFRAVDNNFSTLATGIEAGVMLSEAWELRAYYEYLEADLELGGNAYGKNYGTDALYHFNDTVYAGLGVVSSEIGGIADKAIRATVGHRSFINDNLAWRIEAGGQKGTDEKYNEMFANFGLQWFFGGRDASPEPRQRPDVAPQPAQSQPEPQQPVDSDGDGVIDSKDNCVNTPADYSVDENGCVLYKNETLREEMLVEFDFDSSVVRKSAMGEIEDMANFMKEHPQLNITIHGHTDSVGPEDYNQWLSERRAKAVGDVMVKRFGIDANRVSYKGHGESQPRTMGDSAAARQDNRRIEAELKIVNRVPVER